MTLIELALCVRLATFLSIMKLDQPYLYREPFLSQLAAHLRYQSMRRFETNLEKGSKYVDSFAHFLFWHFRAKSQGKKFHGLLFPISFPAESPYNVGVAWILWLHPES